jgi:hypothetical protein
MESDDDFLAATSSVPDHIGDAPPAPTPVPGFPDPIDPLKPWRSIDVTAYVPMVKWLLKKGFDIPAKKYDPLWELEDFELESIEAPLTEAVQKCLYDLRLSKIADNPYVALTVGLGGLTMVKFMAIRLAAELRAQEKAAQQIPGAAQPMEPSNLTVMPVASSMESGRMRASGGASSFAGSPTVANPHSFVNGFDEGDA